MLHARHAIALASLVSACSERAALPPDVPPDAGPQRRCSAPASMALDAAPPLPLAGGWTHLAVADLDGDGLDDLVTWSAAFPGVQPKQGGRIDVFLGSRDRALRRVADSLPTSPYVFEMGIGDVDGDRRADLLFVDGGHEGGGDALVFRAGNGDGTFAPAQALAIPFASSFAVADIDGDGIADVAAATYGPELVWMRGGDERVSVVRPSSFASTYGQAVLAYLHDGSTLPLAAASVGAVAVGDFDGDRRSDLALAADDATLRVVYGR